MSFRGAPRGRGTGANFGGGAGRGGGGFGGRGGRGGFGQRDNGPPDAVLEIGEFQHACEGEMVCESTNTKIPYFNAPIYLQNKTQIGRVEEILGPINHVYFSVKVSEGIQAASFKAGDKFYIGGDKLLPLEKFLPKPKPPPEPQSQSEQEVPEEEVEVDLCEAAVEEREALPEAVADSVPVDEGVAVAVREDSREEVREASLLEVGVVLVVGFLVDVVRLLTCFTYVDNLALPVHKRCTCKGCFGITKFINSLNIFETR
ncbi:hypothetical protein VTL71DRAFT_11632 [Oculimacula yallundae]|uniref:H/ACA ribonucleoprotein complex subunit n=1 Tax=Oculimacula yallundae TaxID=86028 RepID=A0ABR4CT81_9HELO